MPEFPRDYPRDCSPEIDLLLQFWEETDSDDSDKIGAIPELDQLLNDYEKKIQHKVLSTKGKKIDAGFTSLHWVAIMVKHMMEAWNFNLYDGETAKDIFADFRNEYPALFRLALMWAWG